MWVPQEERGGPMEIRQMRPSLQPRNFRVDLRTKKQTMLKLTFRRTKGAAGPDWQSQAAALRVRRLYSIEPCCHAADDYRPKTAVRGTPGPVMYPSLANFKIAKLLRQETAIALFDGFLGPLIDVGVQTGL